MKTYPALNWRPVFAFICLAGFLTILGLYVGGVAAFLTPDSSWGLVLVALIALGLLTFIEEITKGFENNTAFYLCTGASFCLAYLIILGKTS